MSAPDPSTQAPATAAALRAWLRRQPRRNLLLVALLPVLAAMWWPLVTGGARRAPAAAPHEDMPAAAPLAESAPTTPTAPAAAAIAGTASFEARAHKVIERFQPRWRGATAVPTAEPAPAAPVARPDPAAWSALVPTMILLTHGAAPLAIVQGRACRVGDNVAGRTIVAIEERRVIYRDGDNTITAAMASSLGGQR